MISKIIFQLYACSSFVRHYKRNEFYVHQSSHVMRQANHFDYNGTSVEKIRKKNKKRSRVSESEGATKYPHKFQNIFFSDEPSGPVT